MKIQSCSVTNPGDGLGFMVEGFSQARKDLDLRFH